jgi:hypothetical protein
VNAAGAQDEDFELGAPSTTAVPMTPNEHTAISDSRRNGERNMRSLPFCFSFPAAAEQLKPLEWPARGG